MKRLLAVFSLLICFATAPRAQVNVGMGTNTPLASALLDLTSTSQGFLMPRMTTTQRNAITLPKTGLFVFDKTVVDFYYYTGTQWLPILSNYSGWNTTGNSGTVSSTNFVGTTDSIDFRFRSYNTSVMTITARGRVGLGSTATAPTEPFDVWGDTPLNIHTAAIRGATAARGVALGALSFNFTFGSMQSYNASGVGSSGAPMVIQQDGGFVCVGDTLPRTLLDIKGDLAIRDTTATFTNGNNNNVIIKTWSWVPVTGPSASFTLTGVANPQDGKILVLYNRTTQAMTIANDNINSTAGNRIYTNTGANITTTGTGAVTLIYSTTEAHWILLSVQS